MVIIPKPIQNLIEAFERLPGIGPKTAARLTFYLLHVPDSEVDGLSQAVGRLKKDTVICQTCFNVAEQNPCEICSSPQREREVLAVVESPLDVLALERSGFKGLYHVLQGVIDPLNNIGPEELRIKELLRRVAAASYAAPDGGGGADQGSAATPPPPLFKEIILATNPSVEGEATAMYIANKVRELKTQNLKLKTTKLTRLARGLPVGGDLEYADDVTLGKAIEGRTAY
jgi:recombination protein RecR